MNGQFSELKQMTNNLAALENVTRSTHATVAEGNDDQKHTTLSIGSSESGLTL